uniref:Ribosome-recycling factor, chloroplastic n=1 Tax=Melianthus villosus TaxID=377280 RepID=A0A0G4ANW0_9ROSI|nr:ribosome recycling factor [Melianthus villosus]
MAAYLRRTFSYRNTLLSLRSFSFHDRHFSRVVCSPTNFCIHDTPKPYFVPPVDFFVQTRRGFAKGKKTKADSAESTVVVPNIGPTVKATAVSQMEASIDSLSRELSKLRTGRASAGMLDHIIVESGGVKMPLNRLAVVSVLDPKTLSVNPYDPNAIKELESAIVSSPLGLNPRVDGQRLIAAIPALTKEHIKAMCKVVAKSSEDVKQSIRRARQKALDTVKKAGFPKDDAKRMEKEVDELTKKFVKSAEDMCKAKEKEISEG